MLLIVRRFILSNIYIYNIGLRFVSKYIILLNVGLAYLAMIYSNTTIIGRYILIIS